MNYPNYLFYSNLTSTEFFFESIGSKGVINKVVAFRQTSVPSIYNLGLADYDPNTSEIDDTIITDNGDMEKILATIFQIVIYYLSTNPEHIIYFSGNTPSRTRLYRIAINHSLSEITSFLTYWGLSTLNLSPLQQIKLTKLF
ncbi:MAG: DUF6934 family protein [Runella zeae]